MTVYMLDLPIFTLDVVYRKHHDHPSHTPYTTPCCSIVPAPLTSYPLTTPSSPFPSLHAKS
jgi:hypothetical protein